MNSTYNFYYKAPAEFITESLALFARMTLQPTQKQKLLINETIKSFKNEGVWNLADAIIILHSHDSQAAYLNWKGTSFSAIPVNSPVFTAYSGVTSATGKSISSQFIPSVTTKYQLNDAGVDIYTTINSSAAVNDVARITTGRGATVMQVKSGTDFRARINDNSASANYLTLNIGSETSEGFCSVNLKNSVGQLFKNGIKRHEQSYTPYDVPAAAFTIAGNSNRNYKAYIIRAGLTEAQLSSLNSIISNYLTNYTNE